MYILSILSIKKRVRFAKIANLFVPTRLYYFQGRHNDFVSLDLRRSNGYYTMASVYRRHYINRMFRCFGCGPERFTCIRMHGFVAEPVFSERNATLPSGWDFSMGINNRIS